MNEDKTMNGAEQIINEASAQASALNTVDAERNEMLHAGFSKIHEKVPRTPQEKLEQMYEKIKLYADLGFTQESKSLVDIAEAYTHTPEYMHFHTQDVGPGTSDLEKTFEVEGKSMLNNQEESMTKRRPEDILDSSV